MCSVLAQANRYFFSSLSLGFWANRWSFSPSLSPKHLFRNHDSVGSLLSGLQGREDQLSNDHPFLRQDIVEVLADRVRLDGLDRLPLSPSFECGSHASRPVFEMARHDSHRKDFRRLAFVTVWVRLSFQINFVNWAKDKETSTGSSEAPPMPFS